MTLHEESNLQQKSDAYVLAGPLSRWDDGDHTIYYSFADTIFLSDSNRETHLGSAMPANGLTRQLIREAMDVWESVCGVRFVEVADSPSAELRIAWMPDSESDGPGGTLGGATRFFFGSPTFGLETIFTIDWHDSASTTQIYDTALHELGHIMGIDHSNVRGQVMSGNSPTGPTPYHDQPGRDVLQYDDIAAARALYGPPSGAPVPTPTPTPTNGDDSLVGTRGSDQIEGFAGDDTLHGLRGNDTLRGGSGDDHLFGGVNHSQNGSNETPGGSNVLDGGPGNDEIWAGWAGTGVDGGLPAPGSDVFVFAPGHGDDTVLGNWGTPDGYLHFGASEKVDLTAFGASAPTWEQVSANLRSVDAATSSGQTAPSVLLDLTPFGGGTITFWNMPLSAIDSSDFIGLSTAPPPPTAGAGPDTLRGTDGPDTIDGYGGADAILGGRGDDLLRGGSGSDRLWGQDGNDRMEGGPDLDILWGMSGDDTLEGGLGGDILLAGPGRDVVRGDAGDDLMWGESGPDTLYGDTGHDFVAGGSGTDSLYGGAGNDYLDGEEGNDLLDGGSGYNVLAGGEGDDRLVGSAGGDTFFGQSGRDTFEPGVGVSWIMDWKAGEDLDLGSRAVTDTHQAGPHLALHLDDASTVWLAHSTEYDVPSWVLCCPHLPPSVALHPFLLSYLRHEHPPFPFGSLALCSGTPSARRARRRL